MLWDFAWRPKGKEHREQARSYMYRQPCRAIDAAQAYAGYRPTRLPRAAAIA
jgi:hypothetical protein